MGRGYSSDPATQWLNLWSSLPMNTATSVLWAIGMTTVTILYIQGTDRESPGVDPGLQSTTTSLCVDPGSQWSCALAVSKDDLQWAAQAPCLPYKAPSLLPPGTGGYPREGHPQTGASFQLDFPAATYFSAVHGWGCPTSEVGHQEVMGSQAGWSLEQGGPNKWSRQGNVEPFLFNPAWSRFMAPWRC